MKKGSKYISQLSNSKLQTIAFLCGGVAMLVGISVFISHTIVSQIQYPAATWLGDKQGVPSNYTGHQYPMPTSCYNYADGYGYNYAGLPACSVSNSLGIFSAHLPGSAQGTSVLFSLKKIDSHSQDGSSHDGSSRVRGPMYTYPQKTVGRSLQVAPNSPVTLEWSCQPSQSVTYTYCSFDFFGCVNTAQTSYTLYYSSNASSSGDASFKGSKNITGSVTVYPKTSTTYSLQCGGNGSYAPTAMRIPVSVNGSVPQPTVSITGNGGNPASITVGQTVKIVALFVPAAGDTLKQTAINDSNNNKVPGMSVSAGSQQTYSFTPPGPGTYTFYPAVETTAYPGWDNYGKSLVVTVGAATCNGAHQQGTAPNCTCAAGYNMQNGSCVPTVVSCPNGQNNPPACTTCDPGFVNAGSPLTCTPVLSCPSDPNAQPPSCNFCKVNYSMVAGKCALIPPSLTLSAAQSRVRKNAPAQLSWNVSGLVAGAGETCSITSNPAGLFSATMPANTVPTWAATNQSTGPIQSTTIFALTCTGASATATVGLIPTFIEQ